MSLRRSQVSRCTSAERLFKESAQQNYKGSLIKKGNVKVNGQIVTYVTKFNQFSQGQK